MLPEELVTSIPLPVPAQEALCWGLGLAQSPSVETGQLTPGSSSSEILQPYDLDMTAAYFIALVFPGAEVP